MEADEQNAALILVDEWDVNTVKTIVFHWSFCFPSLGSLILAILLSHATYILTHCWKISKFDFTQIVLKYDNFLISLCFPFIIS